MRGVVERHRQIVDPGHLDARLRAVRHLDELAGVAGLLQLLVALDLVVPEDDVVGGYLHLRVRVGEGGPVEVVTQGVDHRERIGRLVHLHLEAGQVGLELADVGVVVGQVVEQHADHGRRVAVARQHGVEALGVVVDRAEPGAAHGAQFPSLAAGTLGHLGEDLGARLLALAHRLALGHLFVHRAGRPEGAQRQQEQGRGGGKKEARIRAAARGPRR